MGRPMDTCTHIGQSSVHVGQICQWLFHPRTECPYLPCLKTLSWPGSMDTFWYQFPWHNIPSVQRLRIDFEHCKRPVHLSNFVTTIIRNEKLKSLVIFLDREPDKWACHHFLQIMHSITGLQLRIKYLQIHQFQFLVRS